MSFDSFRRGYTEGIKQSNEKLTECLELSENGTVEGFIEGVNNYLAWTHRETSYLKEKDEEARELHIVKEYEDKSDGINVMSMEDAVELLSKGGN